MKKYISFAIYLSVASALQGQITSSNLYGKVIEVTTKDPLEFANIVLRNFEDSVIIQNTTTDQDGGFRFNEIVPGKYFIDVNLIGFATNRTISFEINDGVSLDVGTISLQVSDFRLDEIEITSDHPIFVNAADRKIYYAGQDIQAQSGSVSDILQNIPSVTVESEGEILLRGSSNITFLLNGKTSGLLKNNASVVLQQIPAHTIARIEIITNPSAKYKPDGIAGIINIVTKKNINPGFNGSILGNASTQKRYNGNVSFNYHPGKVNISLLTGYWQNYSPRTYSEIRNAHTDFSLENEAIGKSHSINADLNLDYTANDHNTFGLSGSLFDLDVDRTNDIRTIETTDSAGVVRDFSTFRVNDDHETEFEISAYGEHFFAKEDHGISFEVNWYKADELEEAMFTDTYNFPMFPRYIGNNRLSKIENGATLSIDYTNPLKEDLELESGYEGEFAWGDLDFKSWYLNEDEYIWIADPGKTNRFLYRQNIHAFYTTLLKSFDWMEVQGGLRAEQVNIESELVAYDSIIPNDYFYIFPSLHLNRELGENQEIGLSYSKRINRPDPDELNPFPEYVDIRDIEAGNPYLKPEKVHSIELGYRYQDEKFSFSPTFYYRQTYDALTDVSYYINDTVLLTTLENLNTETSGGIEMIFSFMPSKKLTVNLNSNVFYQRIDASNLGYESDKSAVSSDTKLAAFLNFGSGTKFQLNATYRSASLTAQGESLPLYFLNAGFKQDLFHKSASLTLTVSDVFNSMRWQYVIDTPTLYQKVTRKRKSQIIYLGFTYRFGISSKKDNEEMLFDDKI